MGTSVKMTILFVALCLLAALLIGLIGVRIMDQREDDATWYEFIANTEQRPARFNETLIADLPEPAQRYFRFTIEPGTPLLTAAQIEMRGQVGLGDKQNPKYTPMHASQILAPPYGLVWKLKTSSISGSDGATRNNSWTRFWLFGVVPVVRVSNDTDHQRSAFGRVIAEAAMWSPASLLPHEDENLNVRWQAVDVNTARAIVQFGKLDQAVEITVNDQGQPIKVPIQRWSNANSNSVYQWQPFGGYLSEFKTFQGFNLPTKVEGGNHFGTDAYFPFFKAEVESISFAKASNDSVVKEG